ncbi:MAG: helix-turn-helix domain-containing protein [Candidatus Undinarchaeales archaeon]|jgi:sugar-specific transcriptional regulator TrmB|nr:helix-turn-helix domain-containing protein [Candidatus Undinarchaeales archaeon]
MDEMIAYLRRLGLTEYQARVMIVLFCKHETTAKEICKYGGLPNSKVYQVLKRLEDKGFVSYNYTSPREYVGMRPGKALNMLLKKQEKELDKLKEFKKKRIDTLKKLELHEIKRESPHPMWSTEQYKQ